MLAYDYFQSQAAEEDLLASPTSPIIRLQKPTSQKHQIHLNFSNKKYKNIENASRQQLILNKQHNSNQVDQVQSKQVISNTNKMISNTTNIVISNNADIYERDENQSVNQKRHHLINRYSISNHRYFQQKEIHNFMISPISLPKISQQMAIKQNPRQEGRTPENTETHKYNQQKYNQHPIHFKQKKIINLTTGIQYKPHLERQQVNKTNISTASFTSAIHKDQIMQNSNLKENMQNSNVKAKNGQKSSYFCVESKQGKRSYHEDTYIAKNEMKSDGLLTNDKDYSVYAVFDGHGGVACSQFLKQNFTKILNRSKCLQSNPEEALRETFAKCQEIFLQISDQTKPLETSGSCAVVCLIIRNHLYVANLGDSRALIISNSTFTQLTKDHKPTDLNQKIRIIKNGGKVYRTPNHQLRNNIKIFGDLRIAPGNLNISRTIGDIETKVKKYGGLPNMISSQPEINSFEINQHDILLVSSDGLFEAFSNEAIHKMYQKLALEYFQKLKNKQIDDKQLVQIWMKKLMEEALTRSNDNVTVVMVLL